MADVVRNVVVMGLGLRTPFILGESGNDKTVRDILNMSGATYEGRPISITREGMTFPVANIDEVKVQSNDQITGASAAKLG